MAQEIPVMPQAIEEKLKRRARRKGLKGKRRNAYVYGTMRESGWKPKKERRNG